MSIRVMTAVWDHGPEDQGELLVLLALADFADDSGYCWPSIKSIAHKARLTERGAQKIMRRLEEAGRIETEQNAGKAGTNRYRIVVNGVHPERSSPRTVVHPPPEPVFTPPPNSGSPEPSRNHQEPSVVKIARDEVRDILCEVAGTKAVDSFIAYRKRSKAKALTVTAAERLRTGLRAIFDAGGDPDDALGMAEERGWQTIKPDWYFKEIRDGNGNYGALGAGTPRRAGAGTIDAFAAVAQRRAARSTGH